MGIFIPSPNTAPDCDCTPHPAPLPQVRWAITSGCRQWTGQAGRARAAHGTPEHPGPRSLPRRMGTVRPAHCPWPPHRAAAGPPRHGSMWQGGAAQRAQDSRVQGSRDRESGTGLGEPPGTRCLTWSSRHFGKNTFLRNCREGSSAGEKQGSLPSHLIQPCPALPTGPAPNPQAHPP